MGLLPFVSKVDDNTLMALIKSREFNILFIKDPSRIYLTNFILTSFNTCKIQERSVKHTTINLYL